MLSRMLAAFVVAISPVPALATSGWEIRCSGMGPDTVSVYAGFTSASNWTRLDEASAKIQLPKRDPYQGKLVTFDAAQAWWASIAYFDDINLAFADDIVDILVVRLVCKNGVCRGSYEFRPQIDSSEADTIQGNMVCTFP